MYTKQYKVILFYILRSIKDKENVQENALIFYELPTLH